MVRSNSDRSWKDGHGLDQAGIIAPTEFLHLSLSLLSLTRLGGSFGKHF